MREPIVMVLGMYIMPPDPISMAISLILPISDTNITAFQIS
jgi:hypothetical protein